MEKNKATYLPHLQDSIPEEAFGYTVSMYSVALEGWRRGLTLKFINNNRKKAHIHYKLSYKGREHRFTVARGDAVPKSAIKICVDKDLTKEYLQKAGVSIPKGKAFTEKTNDEEIVNYANELGYPLVIKPTDGTGGSGVIANIENEKEFSKALSYVKYDLGYSNVIVEKYIPGDDCRLHVIDGKVIAAFKKLPANVIGDGKHSIKYLIKEKNKIRTKSPALRTRPIKIDKETHNLLQAKGYHLNSIPKKGEQVFLKTKNNVSAGGDSIDITDELTDEIKQVAIDASHAIPGLVQCGVDMMVDSTQNKGYVIEVNSRPHITAHLFPIKGQARDVPKAVIDYYFPETKQIDTRKKPYFYFDFKSVYEAFQNNFCKEFTIPKAPQGDMVATRFIITGVLQGVNYEQWIRNHAKRLHLHGYIKHLKNGKTSVVVSGSVDSVDQFRKIIKNEAPRRAKILKVVEKSRKRPVKVGFEVIKSDIAQPNTIKKDGYYPVRLVEVPAKKKNKTNKNQYVTKKEARAIIKEYKTLKKEKEFYQKKYNEIKNSNTWRATQPIRQIGKVFKGSEKNN